jgi:sugar phosphate isomerase/epimerase
MRVGRFHLTYCSNIHPGETWHEVSAALADALPRVRALLNVDGPLAIGLRLSARAAETLASGDALDRFRDFLAAGDYYVPTINGFPYGAFHGERVKERVYLPDWRDPARVAYTNRLATLLAELLRDRPDMEGSVSTAPGAFRAHVRTADDVRSIADGIHRHADHLRQIHDATGRTITLAIEPEPACYIETVDDVIVFFRDYLADADIRRFVGVCFDACHMAVEYEEPIQALGRLDAAGIRICKFQISSALRVEAGRRDALAPALGRFADDTYLHQVVERSAHGLTRYTDLPDALQAHSGAASPDAGEWRVHYHVPIFLGTLGDLETTQPDLVALLDALKAAPPSSGRSSCLEVETYTWDVLPPEHRNVDVCTAIARELTWVRSRLEA